MSPIDEAQEFGEQAHRERELLIRVAYWTNLYRVELARGMTLRYRQTLTEAQMAVADLLDEFPRIFDDVDLL